MLIKKIVSVILILSLVFVVSGCQSDKDNPLHGKDTDERIVMCLENAYPEHNFKVVKSFDKQKNEGIFEDENGLEFKVRDLIYNNEDFLKKTKKVVEEKYGQKLVYNKNNMSIDIIYDDNNQITTDEISQLVQEVLNIVDTPKVKYPADREFSTNVVNYYTLPALGVLQCYIEKNEIGETELFYFSDKSMEQSVIKEKIDKLYQSVEE